jgi:hypothetical protein
VMYTFMKREADINHRFLPIMCGVILSILMVGSLLFTRSFFTDSDMVSYVKSELTFRK